MAAIICIVLLLGGFAWPPLWLGLVGYIVYLTKRGQKQRTGADDSDIYQTAERRLEGADANNHFEDTQHGPNEHERAWRDYQKCLDTRQNDLARFRTSAASEIWRNDKGAPLLLRKNSKAFLAATPRGKIISGVFLDHFYPKIEYLEDAAPTALITKQATEFVRKRNIFFSDPDTYRMRYWREFGVHLSYYPVDDLLRGYSLGSIDTNTVVSVAICKNDQEVASSNRWHFNDREAFSRALLENVVYSTNGGERGFSSLTVNIYYVPPDGFRPDNNFISCETLYDDPYRKSHMVGLEGYTKFIYEYLAFVDFILPVLRSPAASSAVEEAEWYFED